MQERENPDELAGERAPLLDDHALDQEVDEESAKLRVNTLTLILRFQDVAYVREQHSELDAVQVGMVSRELVSIMESRHSGKIKAKEMYSKIFTFKKRPVKSATVLHFAIWFTAHAQADPKLIEGILDNLEDPEDVFLPATYPGGRNKTVYVSAVHLAVGLGQTALLKVLTTFACTKATERMQISREVYLNHWAMIAAEEVQVEEYVRTISEPEGGIAHEGNVFCRFYQSVHESSFLGYGDVTLWLLQQRADPCQGNQHGVTPLHFVAFCGISGCVELAKLVSQFQRTGKALAAQADMSMFIPGATRVTPLEVAVCDSSRYPKDQLALLAPCLSHETGTVHHQPYFNDIKLIAGVSAEGALQLVRAIAKMGGDNQEILRRFWMEAQLEGKPDMLASMFYIAPLAAAEILDIMECEPHCEDVAHHPIPSFTSLHGLLFESVPMRCAYQPDIIKKEQLRLPFWGWRMRGDASKDWHAHFLPALDRKRRSSSSLATVNVVACAMPNVLDIDILMALAQLRRENVEGVMSKKMVQGSTFCLWSNLVEINWLKDLTFAVLDLCAWVILAAFPRAIEGTRFRHVCWTFVAAGVLRAVWWALAFIYGYTRKYRLHKFSSDDDAVTLANVWSLKNPWFWSQLFPFVVQASVGVVFVMDTSFAHGDNTAGRSQFKGILLAWVALMATLRFISLWQLSVRGTKIFAIRETFMSAAVGQMFFIATICLACFVVVLMVLAQHQDLEIAISTYRAILFADGDAFSIIGLYETIRGSLVIAFMSGVFVFNIVVLNMLIATYGNEYGRAEKDTPWLFLQGRVQYSVTNILGSFRTPWSGYSANAIDTLIAIVLMLLSLVVAMYFHDIRYLWIGAIILAGGEVLLSMALLQCDWFSQQGNDAESKDRFLWVCHSRDWLAYWSQPEEIEKKQHADAKQKGMDEKFSTMNSKVA